MLQTTSVFRTAGDTSSGTLQPHPDETLELWLGKGAVTERTIARGAGVGSAQDAPNTATATVANA